MVGADYIWIMKCISTCEIPSQLESCKVLIDLHFQKYQNEDLKNELLEVLNKAVYKYGIKLQK